MNTQPKRRWYQFTLLRLFAVVTLISVGFGFWLRLIGPSEIQRSVVAKVRGKVVYEEPSPNELWPVRQLREWLPRDYFDPVIAIYGHATDEGLHDLSRLTELRGLHIEGSPITDAGMAQLRQCSQLRWLSLNRTKVSDTGIAHLEGLRVLESLDLADTGITDAGLVHLGRLECLRSLNLRDTKVTIAGLAHLQGLAKLEVLELDSEQVTSYTRMNELQMMLPECKLIIR